MKLKLCICAILLSGLISSLRAVEGPVFLKRACAPAFNSDSSVSFFWDIPGDTCNSFSGYYLYGRESSANAYSLLDSIKNFNVSQYTYKLPNTKLTWQFFISVRGSCNGNDSFNSAIISIDKDPPSATLLDSVSVNLSSQKILMGWQANLSPDLWGYTLYRRADSSFGFTEILDLKGESYEYTGSNTATDITYLSIASMDSCQNLGAISWQHRTIQLKHKIDTCKKEISLDWTPYIGWQSQNYKVFADTNESGVFAEVANLNANVFQFTYKYIAGRTYKFFVRSFKLGDNFTSSSNLIVQATRKIKAPKFNYISTVTVKDNKNLLIRFLNDTESEVAYFYILRCQDSVNFKLIDSIQNNPSVPVYHYLDSNVDVQNEKYFYRVDAYNACRLLFSSSNISHNIILKLDPQSSTYKLLWNNYTYWPNGVENFSIARGVNPGSGYIWTEISQTAGDDDYLYVDDNSPISSSGFAICYEVLAMESPGNPLSIQDSSRSNQVCAVLDATITFPNAFVPNGINNTFKPIGRFINWERSVIHIYNRWGEEVWQSNGLDYAWDGLDMNGNPCLPGIYYFKSKIIGYRGNVLNKSGTINLIR